MRRLIVVVVGILVGAAQGYGAVTIDLVAVGNLRNDGEWSGESYGGLGPDRICGAVDYAYSIGKYEVTAGQYRDFLNAVDPTGTNPHSLYNSNMNDHSWGCQITWNSGASTYDFSGRPSGTAADWAYRPVNFVSFWDAARFTNWLHNGQGDGDTESGAYRNIGDENNFAREDGALFFIPTEDEWYKAAYYDGAADVYYDYPTSSDTAPGRDMTETTNPGNNANYYADGPLIGDPYHRTTVGEFELSDSPYGTFDQGGNVWEWNENRVGSYRQKRGGSQNRGDYTLHALYRSHVGYPMDDNSNLGFRVASSAVVPEPSTFALLAFSIGTFMIRGVRKPS